MENKNIIDIFCGVYEKNGVLYSSVHAESDDVVVDYIFGLLGKEYIHYVEITTLASAVELMGKFLEAGEQVRLWHSLSHIFNTDGTFIELKESDIKDDEVLNFERYQYFENEIKEEIRANAFLNKITEKQSKDSFTIDDIAMPIERERNLALLFPSDNVFGLYTKISDIQIYNDAKSSKYLTVGLK